MNINRMLLTSSIVLMSIMMPISGYTYEKADHARMNTYIGESEVQGFSLDSYLRDSLGFKNGYKEIIGGIWGVSLHGYEFRLGSSEDLSVLKSLANGGRYEDNPPIIRSVSHFHNPLRSWLEAGFKGGPCSSIIWAQSDNQAYGKYSWQDVRSYFYEALTAVDPDDQVRNYVKVFEGLGAGSRIPIYQR